MLPPFIIEQIRQREQRERARRDDNRPRLELPIEHVPGRPHSSEGEGEGEDEDEGRGVVIVDVTGPGSS
jgi:hypothetical protein